ncbi:MAG TPA: bifunctional (p)ppGpp synthetase/guanosine-3',5'-bis(diphosphate) 3'-pyrophosphohydrolase, partial [Acidiferrobacteraceae bacterium]|nr:bifunctional (p)ppGpp synthetase/guanosine-3',5'-bis(diphosphate) 3'-pyrophosphohydrolase [Acidiferrobacteraceae bacterium]HEX19884.1 bifunctional (p)ppGpp synthetase/guanosine-3',5'-bis(diphosphate) 3'-pyrophosphohydrolase [Acidiferrobacteraceae bacterium]
EKWIDIQWEPDLKGVFPVSIRLDVKNKRGVLAAVAATISDLEANIDTLSFSDRDSNFTTMDFTLEVRDRVHLANIIRAIRRYKSVQRVYRRKG